jgi:SAM-dependent methyltransferase
MISNIVQKLTPDWFKIFYYKFRGSRPWSKGYFTFKFQFIKGAINNPEIIKRFENSESLPEGYGFSLDERVVEYPWFLSRISALEGKLLDAGSALNFKEILGSAALKNKKITIINLNPEPNCFWQKGISYIYGDIRETLFKDNYFDHITCISTLEHIGMDNIIYSKDLKYREGKIFDFEKAILELKRVLKTGGSLFITVPFGKYQNFGRFHQFDSKLVSRILEIFGPERYFINYYKYTKKGWNISDEASCADSEYFDIYTAQKMSPDCAAASRAVACLKLIK